MRTKHTTIGTAEAAQLLAQWPVGVAELRKFKDVFRVRTSEADYVLKPLNKTRRRARYICGLTERLAEGESPLTPALVRTTSGSPMFSENDRRHWILCEWIGGRTTEWASLDDARFCTAALARFHQASRDYRPGPGQRPRVYFGRWPEKLVERRAGLRRYVREARDRVVTGQSTSFEELAVVHGPRLLRWADQAYQTLLESEYPALCAKYQSVHQVVHGDPAGRNFVVTEYGRTRIIDLETIRQDIPALDVAKLLRRALKKHRWQPDVALDLLRAYGYEQSLEPEMMPIVWTFLAFPTKVYRDLNRYYEERPGWSYRRHLLKLRKHLRYARRQDDFLEWAYERFVVRRGGAG